MRTAILLWKVTGQAANVLTTLTECGRSGVVVRSDSGNTGAPAVITTSVRKGDFIS